METEEEKRLKYKIQDLEREIEKLQAQINKQADEIFKKDCEISRLEEYKQRCHRSYDAWALDPERS
jgi:chromosome segregation ATPase